MTCAANPDNESIVIAAQWLADEIQPQRPIIQTLKSRFGLSALEATEACAMAERFRMIRRAMA
ncbi:hypothetical protein [Sinorhizobium fredii]|uniref:hypothetical protein n=1 Tax=Rhizobium fredii TaxID=380 RepID=UPI0004B43957|nr:hypothetical protein [Sinorhizobium fredii]